MPPSSILRPATHRGVGVTRGADAGFPHPHRRADGPDRSRRLAAADRSHVRPARPEVLLRLGHDRRASSPDRRSPPPTSDRSTRCCSATTTTATTSIRAGRALLPSAGVVITTASGAKRLGGDARGLEPWATTRLEAPGRPTIEITATPCRHGPPLSHSDRRRRDRLRAPMGRPGTRGAVDLGRHGALRRRARGRRPPPGRHRAPASRRRPLPGLRAGPLHDDGAGRGRAVPSRPPAHRHPDPLRGVEALPGGREAIERELASAPEDLRRRIQWLPIGVTTRLPA